MGTDRFFRLVLVAALALPGGVALAQEPQFQVQMLDPWVPPSVREKAALEPAAESVTPWKAAERKLRARFEAAAGDGRLTRAEAQAAGLLAIARDFPAIDARGAGAIAFEDYKRFLQARGARLD